MNYLNSNYKYQENKPERKELKPIVLIRTSFGNSHKSVEHAFGTLIRMNKKYHWKIPINLNSTSNISSRKGLR